MTLLFEFFAKIYLIIISSGLCRLQVCNYHKEFYRPENLCIIITGQVSAEAVFTALKPFEESYERQVRLMIAKIIAKIIPDD